MVPKNPTKFSSFSGHFKDRARRNGGFTNLLSSVSVGLDNGIKPHEGVAAGDPILPLFVNVVLFILAAWLEPNQSLSP